MTIELEFIQGAKGRNLLTRWPSPESHAPVLILLQPFAEEQNRLRRIFRQLAEPLQQLGWEVWLLDNFGTGDSDGEFEQIDFDVWQQDLAQVICQRVAHGRPYSLLACRFSALQLVDLIKKYNIPPLDKLVLWQPQLDAKLFWQQQWRQILASEILVNKDKAPIAEQLRSGQSIDLAGYHITPDFYQQVLTFTPDLNVLAWQPLLWLESSVQPTPSIAAQKLWQQLPQNAVRRQLATVDTPLYWLSQEPVDTSLLIEKTIEFLQEQTDA
jgi:exosortase A-associated hydrolase 2